MDCPICGANLRILNEISSESQEMAVTPICENCNWIALNRFGSLKAIEIYLKLYKREQKLRFSVLQNKKTV